MEAHSDFASVVICSRGCNFSTWHLLGGLGNKRRPAAHAQASVCTVQSEHIICFCTFIPPAYTGKKTNNGNSLCILLVRVALLHPWLQADPESSAEKNAHKSEQFALVLRRHLSPPSHLNLRSASRRHAGFTVWRARLFHERGANLFSTVVQTTSQHSLTAAGEAVVQQIGGPKVEAFIFALIGDRHHSPFLFSRLLSTVLVLHWALVSFYIRGYIFTNLQDA